MNPNLEDALSQLGLVHSHIGLFDEALEGYQKLAAINPNSPPLVGFGNTLLWQGKHAQALAHWLSLQRGSFSSYIGSQTAWALFQLGRRDEATAKLEEFLKLDPADTGGNLAGMQAVLFADAGKKREAEDKIKSAMEKSDYRHFHHAAYYIASAYALSGEPEQSIYRLEQAAETGFPCFPLFERDPNLDPIRKSPRFIALMANLKARWEDYRARL